MEQKKKPAQRKKKKVSSAKQTWVQHHSLALLIAGIGVVVSIAAVLAFAFIPYTDRTNEEGDWVFIPRHSSNAAVKDSLKTNLGSAMGTRVYVLWRMMGGSGERSIGAYRVERGQTALSISHRIATGRQSPVNVTFNGTRTMRMLADRISSRLECTPEEFLVACASELPAHGFTEEQFPAAFIPDSYEFYWSTKPSNVVKRLLDYRDRFWTPEREAKAKALGLSKVEVATVASIIEEETAKADERPKVARLYLNRLAKGMRLQADPTVKYAVGDFSLRRITGEHLKQHSPYNTYLVSGLPPGPIRVATASAIDDVLNAPMHPYIYMCAKEDFSGYHNFATDYATHQANARRYQAALNARGIR